MSFSKRTIESVPIHGKTVLLRVDYNVPQNEDGSIADDFRIRASLPTIKRLIREKCKIIIISHLGRPDGEKNLKYSLEPAAQRLAELLGRSIRFVDCCIGDKACMAVKQGAPGSITVLENLRFHPGEEANDEDFARQLYLAAGADYFVQDGFGVVHRAHASTEAITHFLPSVAGLLLEKEVDTITDTMEHPKHPVVAVLGGAKVSDKIHVFETMIDIADHIVVGGAMANTFLAYKGVNVGRSKCETDQDEMLSKIYKKAVDKVGLEHIDDFILLPTDVAVTTDINSEQPRQEVDIWQIPADDLAVDIGKNSTKAMIEVVEKAKTVIWNGTLGLAEKPEFAYASIQLARALKARKDSTTSVIGGGDTADFALNWDKDGKSFSHVSTGGGASLDLMTGKKLPGVESLLDARRDIRYTKNKKT